MKLLQNYYSFLSPLLFKSFKYENDTSIMHEEDNGKRRTRLENTTDIETSSGCDERIATGSGQ